MKAKALADFALTDFALTDFALTDFALNDFVIALKRPTLKQEQTPSKDWTRQNTGRSAADRSTFYLLNRALKR